MTLLRWFPLGLLFLFSSSLAEQRLSMAVFEDPTGEMTLEHVLARQGEFKPVAGQAANFGVTASAYWLRLHFAGPDQTSVLEVMLPQLDEVSLFEPSASGWRERRGGDSEALSARDLRYPHAVFLIPPGGQERTLYLRVRSTSAMQVPLRLSPLPEFAERAYSRSLFYGAYYGLLAVMLVYNLLLLASLRDGVFLSYVVYLASLLLLQLSISGDAFVWLWSQSSVWVSRSAPFFGALAVAAMTWLARDMVRAPEVTPRLARLASMISVAAVLLTIASLFLRPIWTVAPALVLAMLMVPLALVMALLSARRGVVEARIFLIAWSMLLLGVFVFGLKMLGLLPQNVWTQHALHLGSAAEVALISFALAYRVRTERAARHQAESDLHQHRRLARLKGEFVATVSHELRTPMTAISGSLKLLLGGAGGQLDAGSRRLIEIADGNTDRLIRLINDLLDIEKIERDAMSFHFTCERITPLLRMAIEQMEGFACRHQVTVQLVAESQGLEAHVDVDRFVQVVTNLLSNAIKFSPSGATVTVELRRVPEGVCLEVADTGRGIDEAFQPHVFEKFAQQSDRQRPSDAGTGLGLAICKRIVEAHQGTIGFFSVPGEGSRFSVVLPPPGTSRAPALSDAML